MFLNKRQRNSSDLDDLQTKELCLSLDKKIVTTIENISNELLLELFEYFNSYELYTTFWNLNNRFRNLLMCASYLLKIKLHFGIDLSNYFEDFIFPNRYRILSLELIDIRFKNRFLKSITLDSSFHRLEHIRLPCMEKPECLIILKSFLTLPHLVSLHITIGSDSHPTVSLTEIYQLIFILPALKSFCVYGRIFWSWTSLDMNVTNQYSTLESITMHHNFLFSQLIVLPSYIPQLRRLTWHSSTIIFDVLNPDDISFTFPNLCCLTFEKTNLRFTDFELLIKTMSCPLRLVRIDTKNDSKYLDADQWERLITQYLPHLYTFDLKYNEKISISFHVNNYHTLLHRFTSSFWTERQWILHLKCDHNWNGYEMIYSISPYKKQWYNLPLNITNINCVSPAVQLTANYLPSIEVCFLFTLLPITALDISCIHSIFLRELMSLIKHLPNLDNLRISSVPSTATGETDTCHMILCDKKTKITKVNVQYVFPLVNIEVLFEICPLMEYLEIEGCYDNDFQSLLRCILTKNNKSILHLRTIAFRIEENVEKTIKELHVMVKTEKLLNDFTIQFIDEKLYIQWKER